MQPAQLSLLPDPTPPPPTSLLADLPEPDVGAAIAELARLLVIATTAESGEASDD